MSVQSVFSFLVVLLLLPSLASAQTGSVSSEAIPPSDGILRPKGPIPHRNSEPLNTPFLAPNATDASVLRTGSRRIDFNVDVVNNLLTIERDRPKLYITDFEEQRFYVGYAQGIGRGQELGIRTVFIARNGGILDTFINNWHAWFGFDGGGRDNLPDYRTLYRINNAAGQTVLSQEGARSGLGDTVLEYRRSLTALAPEQHHSRQVAVTARALVKLPTGSSTSLFGSGNTDIGIGVAITGRPLRNLALHGNLSQVFLGKPRQENLTVRNSLTHWVLAGEYLFDGRTSFVAQTDENPSPFRAGILYPDRPRRAFTFGFWRDVGHGLQIFIANAENDFGPIARTAPDFVLSLGTRWSLH